MSMYTTTTRVIFSTPDSAAKFIHFLDQAESEMTNNDFGPGWLGNILSLFDCLNTGFCECNGAIISLEGLIVAIKGFVHQMNKGIVLVGS